MRTVVYWIILSVYCFFSPFTVSGEEAGGKPEVLYHTLAHGGCQFGEGGQAGGGVGFRVFFYKYFGTEWTAGYDYRSGVSAFRLSHNYFGRLPFSIGNWPADVYMTGGLDIRAALGNNEKYYKTPLSDFYDYNGCIPFSFDLTLGSGMTLDLLPSGRYSGTLILEFRIHWILLDYTVFDGTGWAVSFSAGYGWKRPSTFF